jgi:uncharacterized membrane protein YraQ (UPF0718 family)
VLPAVAGLLAVGTPLPPVMVFLATSPLVSPSVFMITLGGLGWNFALGKLFSAMAVGGIVALGTAVLVQAGWLRDQVQQGVREHVSASPGST